MNRKLLLPVLALALAVLACNLPATATPTSIPTGPVVATVPVPTNTAPVPLPPTQTTAPVPPTPTNTTAPGSPTATVPAGGGLTLDALKNATYHAPYYNRTIKLTNGSYTEGTPTTYSVMLLGVYSFGDLTGDGKNEAAVILAESGGGSGVFESLIVMEDKPGGPHQTGEAELGDRVLIKTVDISQGVVHLDMVVDAPNDPLCCPTLPEKQNYWLFGDKLTLMRVTTTANNTERVITIDSPAHWTTVSNPFTVSGSVTVLPFENTLAVHIYKVDGTKVNDSSLLVTPTNGTAGKFSQQFNLSNAGITDWVIIQFVDTSAADGSIIAMGSVILRAH